MQHWVRVEIDLRVFVKKRGQACYLVHGSQGMKTCHNCSGEMQLLLYNQKDISPKAKEYAVSHKGNVLKKVVLISYCCVTNSAGQKSSIVWPDNLLSLLQGKNLK
jgi:hypothetical protein